MIPTEGQDSEQKQPVSATGKRKARRKRATMRRRMQFEAAGAAPALSVAEPIMDGSISNRGVRSPAADLDADAAGADQRSAEAAYAAAVEARGQREANSSHTRKPRHQAPATGPALRDALQLALARSPASLPDAETAPPPAAAPSRRRDGARRSRSTGRRCLTRRRIAVGWVKARPVRSDVEPVRHSGLASPVAHERAASRRQNVRPRTTGTACETAVAAPAPESAPAKIAPTGSTWALPLPAAEEPLVLATKPDRTAQSAGQTGDAPVPLAKDRALVPWRDGLFAPLEDWFRASVARLARALAPRRPPTGTMRRRRTPAPAPIVPAMARANREIAQLRKENEGLRLQLRALEQIGTFQRPGQDVPA